MTVELVQRQLLRDPAYDSVKETALHDHLPLRDAALSIAIQRVSQAIKLRDFV